MKEQLVSFETAKLLKEKGFNEKVFKQYKEDHRLERISSSIDVVIGPYEEFLYAEHYPAPTQAFAQKWLREKYWIHVVPEFRGSSGAYYCWIYKCSSDSIHCDTGKGCTAKRIEYRAETGRTKYWSYEQALEAGLIESLNLITE